MELAGGPEPGPFRKAVLEAACATLGADLACLEILDGPKGQFEFAAVEDRGGSRLREGLRIPVEGSSSARVRDTGTTLVLEDPATERRFEDLQLFEGFRSGLKVPLRDAGVFLGVLDLWSREPEHFGDLEQDSARLLGSLVVAQARAAEATTARETSEEAERRLRRYEGTLDRIGEGVVAIDPEGKVQWSNRAAARLLGRIDQGLEGAALPELLCDDDPEGAAGVTGRLGKGSWHGRLRLRRGEGGFAAAA